MSRKPHERKLPCIQRIPETEKIDLGLSPINAETVNKAARAVVKGKKCPLRLQYDERTCFICGETKDLMKCFFWHFGDPKNGEPPVFKVWYTCDKPQDGDYPDYNRARLSAEICRAQRIGAGYDHRTYRACRDTDCKNHVLKEAYKKGQRFCRACQQENTPRIDTQIQEREEEREEEEEETTEATQKTQPTIQDFVEE
jgi:hypothetical protein